MRTMILNLTGGGGFSVGMYAGIRVSYIPGSVCTCSDGVTTLIAPDTSGSVLFEIPYAGTWSVSDGSKTESVSITHQAQLASVNISETIFFYRGQESLSDFRTHWRRVDSQSSTSINVSGDDYYTFASTGTNLWGWQYTSNKIDLTNYSKLRLYGYRDGNSLVGFNTSNSASASKVSANGELQPGTTDGVYESDISTLTGQYYFGIRCTGATLYVKKVTLL